MYRAEPELCADVYPGREPLTVGQEAGGLIEPHTYLKLYNKE